MAYEKIHESPYGHSPHNYHLAKRDDALILELTYPDLPGDHCRFIEIDQESVRASDGIRVHYDYDRDGWVICQPKWDDDGNTDWQETAFVQSWARQPDSE